MKLDQRTVLRVAVESDADPKTVAATVRRLCNGEPVRSRVGVRVAEALQRMGITVSSEADQ